MPAEKSLAEVGDREREGLLPAACQQRHPLRFVRVVLAAAVLDHVTQFLGRVARQPGSRRVGRLGDGSGEVEENVRAREPDRWGDQRPTKVPVSELVLGSPATGLRSLARHGEARLGSRRTPGGTDAGGSSRASAS